MSKKKPRFYTTSIPASRRVAQTIEMMADYPDLIDSYHVLNEGGSIAVLAVQIDGVGYRFRPNTPGVKRRMEESGLNLEARSTPAPEDVAWAQLHHLLQMQLEAVASGVAGAEDVFGGYALVQHGTVGDMIRERRAELMPGEQLLLTSG